MDKDCVIQIKDVLQHKQCQTNSPLSMVLIERLLHLQIIMQISVDALKRLYASLSTIDAGCHFFDGILITAFMNIQSLT